MKLTHFIRLSLVFFLLTGNIVSGQHHLIIIDRGSIRPVPDVYAICNDLQVAVSGPGGVMQLPEGLPCDVLLLSHVGYHNLILSTSDLPADTTLYLNPLRKKLDEVIVTSTPFRRIISAVPGSISLLPRESMETGQHTGRMEYGSPWRDRFIQPAAGRCLHLIP